ncbi:MAG: ABC transporter permease, partial [Blastocatellia bacterium]|nr:ABC transporter permease [Blastocatellia bacterium]
YGWVPLIARLRPGATIEQAQDEMRSLISQILPLFPWPMPANWNASATVIALQESMVGDIRVRLLVLLGAVGLVLLIACANVASLLLARTTARQREISIRAALGAARGRIARQLLTESVLLAFAGAGLGIILAFEGLSVLKSILPLDNPHLAQASIDWQVIAFVTALTILTGLSFGLAPAISASRLNLAESLRGRRQQSTGMAGIRLRSWLITGEVALAVVLVIGAGLLIKSLWALTQVNPGFRPEQILTIRVFPDRSLCQERAGCIAFYDRLMQRSRGITGVSEVSAANTLPLSPDIPSLPVELEGHPFIPSENKATIFWAGAITPDYLQIMQIPLLAGRAFTYADGEKSAGVVLVSAETARHFWPDENPIGKRIRVVWDEQWRTVVGVVGDVRQYNLAGKSPDWINGEFYMPYPQAVGLDRQLPATMSLILRTTADPRQVASDIRRFVASSNPNTPISEVRNLEGVVSASRSESSSLMWLFIIFGGSALILAAVGTYGVVSYATTQRRYEMGVRIALGATRSSIFRLVLGQSLRLVLIGVAIGVVVSLALTRIMTGFLYGVTATDPMTFLGVSVLLIAVAILAGYTPARRAATVDPMTALRQE